MRMIPLQFKVKMFNNNVYNNITHKSLPSLSSVPVRTEGLIQYQVQVFKQRNLFLSVRRVKQIIETFAEVSMLS
jgi:hypothetical protein